MSDRRRMSDRARMSDRGRMSGRTRLLITGATGRVGRAVVAGLGERYHVRAFGRAPVALPGVAETALGDIADLEAFRAAARGMEAILHLAAVARSRAAWEDVRDANIDGAYNCFEAARLEGIRRVVFASTSQVINGYPPDQPITWATPPRPQSYYAASKVFGEALGAMYADQHGLEVVCVRIGTFWAEGQRPPEAPRVGKYLSARDAVQLFDLALSRPGLRYEIVYGVSDNPRCRFDLEHTRQVLGYAPQDAEE